MAGGRTPFTKDDDKNLVAYLATYNPTGDGRSGNLLYKQLEEKTTGKWKWTLRHPWQSWRDRYYKNEEEFDARIRRYLKRNAAKQASEDSSEVEEEPTPPKKKTTQPKRKRESDAAAGDTKRVKVDKQAVKKSSLKPSAKRSQPETASETETDDSQPPPAKTPKSSTSKLNVMQAKKRKEEEEEETQKEPGGQSKVGDKKPPPKKRPGSPPVPSSCSPKRDIADLPSTNAKIASASNQGPPAPTPAQKSARQEVQPGTGPTVKIIPRQQYTTRSEETFYTDTSTDPKTAKPPAKPAHRPLPRVVEGPYKTSHIEDQRMDTGGDVPKLPLTQSKKPEKPNAAPKVRISAPAVTERSPVIVERPRRITIDREIQTGSPKVHLAKLADSAYIPSPTPTKASNPTTAVPKPSPKRVEPRASAPSLPHPPAAAPAPIPILPPPLPSPQKPSPPSITAPLPAGLSAPQQDALPQPRAASLPRLPHSPNDPFFSSGAGTPSTKKKEKPRSPVDRRHSSPNPLIVPQPPVIDLRVEMSKRLQNRKSLAATRPSTSEPHIPSYTPSRTPSSSTGSVLSRGLVRSPSLPVPLLARDKEVLEQLGLERAIQLMAQRYGFHEDAVWDLWKAVNDLEKTEELAKKMRIAADAAVAEELGKLEGRGGGVPNGRPKAQNGLVLLDVSTRGSGEDSDSPHKQIKNTPPSSGRRRSSNQHNLRIGPPKEDDTMSEYDPPHGSRAGRYTRLVREGRKDEALIRESKSASGSRRESFPLAITDYHGTPTSSSSAPLKRSSLTREKRRTEALDDRQRQRRRLSSEEVSTSEPADEDIVHGENELALDQDEEGEVAHNLDPLSEGPPGREQNEMLPPSSPSPIPSTPALESHNGDRDSADADDDTVTEMDVEEDDADQSLDDGSEEDDDSGSQGEQEAERDDSEGDDESSDDENHSVLGSDDPLFTQKPTRPERPIKKPAEWDAKEVQLLLNASKKTATAAKKLEKGVHPDLLLQWTASQLSKFC